MSIETIGGRQMLAEDVDDAEFFGRLLAANGKPNNVETQCVLLHWAPNGLSGGGGRYSPAERFMAAMCAGGGTKDGYRPGVREQGKHRAT